MKKPEILKFFENVGSLFSVKVIDLMVSIWIIPFLIYKVGLENFGIYAFAISITLFFSNIINYGFDLEAVRRLVNNRKKQKIYNQVFSEVFSVKLFLLVVILVLLMGLTLIVPQFNKHKLLYLFSALYLIGNLFSLKWFFMGMERMRWLPLINAGSNVLFALLIFLFIDGPKDYSYILLFESLAFSLASLISFIYAFKVFKIQITFISLKSIGSYLYTNFSSFINLLLPSVFSNIAVLLVGFFSVPAQVSIMQIGVKVSNAFATVNAVLTKAFYTTVNRRKSSMKLSFKVLLLIGFLLSACMFVSVDYFITPWLQLKDAEILNNVTFLIKLLSPTPFLMALISAYGVNGLLILKKDKTFGVITLIATFVGLIAGFLSSPVYSFIGGALFLLVARGVYALMAVVYFRKSANKIEIKNS